SSPSLLSSPLSRYLHSFLHHHPSPSTFYPLSLHDALPISLRLGFGNCLFGSPSSSYASASGLAFRDTRQRRPIAGPWPCRHEKLDSSEIARAGDQCRRGFAALRSDVQVDFAFLGSWHAVCGGEPAGRAGTVELDFRAIHAGSLRGMETNRSGDLRATRNRASRAGVRMR